MKNRDDLTILLLSHRNLKKKKKQIKDPCSNLDQSKIFLL